jgi:hypothetical protein
MKLGQNPADKKFLDDIGGESAQFASSRSCEAGARTIGNSRHAKMERVANLFANSVRRLRVDAAPEHVVDAVARPF